MVNLVDSYLFEALGKLYVGSVRDGIKAFGGNALEWDYEWNGIITNIFLEDTWRDQQDDVDGDEYNVMIVGYDNNKLAIKRLYRDPSNDYKRIYKRDR